MPKQKSSQPKQLPRRTRYPLTLNLDKDDHDLLVATAEKEKLTLSDTARRAIRAHALHVKQATEPVTIPAAIAS